MVPISSLTPTAPPPASATAAAVAAASSPAADVRSGRAPPSRAQRLLPQCRTLSLSPPLRLQVVLPLPSCRCAAGSRVQCRHANGVLASAAAARDDGRVVAFAPSNASSADVVGKQKQRQEQSQSQGHPQSRSQGPTYALLASAAAVPLRTLQLAASALMAAAVAAPPAASAAMATTVAAAGAAVGPLAVEDAAVSVNPSALVAAAAAAVGAAAAPGGDGGSGSGIGLLPDWGLWAGAGALGGGVVFGVVKAGVYFRMQYITAAMLGRHVPRNGARVLDLNSGSGRYVYYLPDSVATVVALSPSVEPKLLKGQALSAGVEVEIPVETVDKSKPPLDRILQPMAAMPSASFDAVVSVGAFASLPDSSYTRVVDEVTRVLKPGKPFIFVERQQEQLDEDRPFFLTSEEAQRFSRVDYDLVLPWVDAHVVGVAVNSLQPPTPLSVSTPPATAFAATTNAASQRRRRGQGKK